MTAVNATLRSPGIPADSPSLGGLISWADQVAAAVAEVQEAWRGFLYGPAPDSTGGESRAIPEERLERGTQVLQEQVSRLQLVAESIRQHS